MFENYVKKMFVRIVILLEAVFTKMYGTTLFYLEMYYRTFNTYQ